MMGPSNNEIVCATVLAAFGSDKVAILTPDANQPSGYAIQQIQLAVTNPAGNYGAVGPRGLAGDPQGTGPGSPSTIGLVWVANHAEFGPTT